MSSDAARRVVDAITIDSLDSVVVRVSKPQTRFELSR